MPGVPTISAGDLSPGAGTTAQKSKRLKGDIVHLKSNDFFKTVNGYVEGDDEDLSKHNYFSLKDLTKLVWPLYLPLQIFGLFDERMNKLARAWYGTCWSIVYTCLRPWKENREALIDSLDGKVHDVRKKLHKANEHFRVGMGSLVSAIYGSGALGMLWGAISGNDEFFDKSVKVYRTGMFNQDQIFSSMNLDIVLKRKNNFNQLDEIDQRNNSVKASVELVDSILFVPTIITRALDTAKLFFGINLSEGVERFTNALAYFKYGTWATKFGNMKAGDKKQGGDLYEVKKSNKPLYYTQMYGAQAFYSTLPALSWAASICELFGARELAEKVFNLEGILERLNPTIAAWCLTNPWLQGYLQAMPYDKASYANSNHG